MIKWMMGIACLGAVAGLAGYVNGQEPVDADIVEVTAMGEGITPDEARSDALRQALERGGAVEIASRSEVESFELIRDTIYSRADGIVTDYKVLEEGDAVGGVKFCKIRAKIRKSAIALNWGEVQNVLDQIGRPGVAVWINEYIDGRPQETSILETQIEKRLNDVGFKMYASAQLRALAQRESADATAEGNAAKLAAVAKDFETQIFITGTAQANGAGVKVLAGEETAMYNCDAQIKMYHTDTGLLLASESIPNERGGARGYHEHSIQAGKKALENAGKKIVEDCYRTVMQKWATQISAGGELELEIEGMSVVDAIKLKKKLAEIPKVENVHGPSVTKGVAKFRIQAKMTAETLVEYLVGDEWQGLIEVVDLKSNRIQAKKAAE